MLARFHRARLWAHGGEVPAPRSGEGRAAGQGRGAAHDEAEAEGGTAR